MGGTYLQLWNLPKQKYRLGKKINRFWKKYPGRDFVAKIFFDYIAFSRGPLPIFGEQH